MRRSYRRRTCVPPRAPPCAGDIPAPHPVLLVALPARLSRSRHRRRRASAEPRAGHRADRAPPTSSYVRRSSRCQPRVPCRLRCSVPTVVTASGFCCFSAHHRSELVASAGSEQAPHRERAAVPVVRQPCWHTITLPMIVLGSLLLLASAAAVSGDVEPSSVTSAANDVRRSRFWLPTVSPIGHPSTKVPPSRRGFPVSPWRVFLPRTDDGPPGSPPWRALLRRRPSRRPPSARRSPCHCFDSSSHQPANERWL